MSDNFTTRTASLRATLAQIRKLDTKELSIDGQNIETIFNDFAKLNEANTFTANNTFSVGLQVLPLGTTTMSGQDAYGLSIAPPNEDGTAGGLQLWGVQFSMGDEWSETALKINHPQLALFGTSAIPTTISFDNANVVEFKTMPDDGSATGVTYDFQSWQWTDDTHTDKTNTAPVQILKNNAISLNEKSVLNMGESDNRYYTKLQSDDRYAEIDSDNIFHGDNSFDGNIGVLADAYFYNGVKKGGTADENEILNRSENDARYAQLDADNTFTANNTFEQEVILENGATSENTLNVTNGDILINEGGNLTFFDDGVATIGENNSGSYYKNCSSIIPNILDHNKIYDFGLISEDKDLSIMQFSNSTYLVQTCEIWFKTGDTVYNITWPENIYWIDSSTGAPPEFNTNMKYRIAIRNEFDTIVASLSYSYPNLS